jgi:ABC-type branched-subunit amino acid transport system ATPase component/branched-subunit amino acid ABC-type transport system permease component
VNLWITFTIIGLGLGSLYASLAVGLVITFKGTGFVNFAHATTAAWGAFTFAELRQSGGLVLPVIGIPDRISLGANLGVPAALTIALISSAGMGLLLHLVVFRPLAGSPTLTKVVASVGVMIVAQGGLALKFGSETRSVETILPDDSITLLGVTVPGDRLAMSAVALVLSGLIWAWFRFSLTGLAIQGASENESAASFAAFSPQHLSAITWVLATVSSTVMVILIAPITGLNPASSTLWIIPALAVGLLGRLSSIMQTALAGLALGCFESLVAHATTKTWFPSWAIPGHNEVVPFAVIISALFIVGRALPARGAVLRDRLPEVIVGERSPKTILGAALLAALAILATGGSYRFAIITSMIGAIIALSLVLLTGLVGQISLAQAAIAGTSGFVLSKLGDAFPFPFDLFIAVGAATILGTVIGIPALRIRGAQLAVVTMAAAVALEQTVFRNPNFSSPQGNPIKQPSLFGWSLAVRQGQNIARAPFAFLVLLMLVLTTIGVGNLIRSATGRSFLAVRANERAAASVGVNVSATKLLAFAASSFVAGIGGALLGYSRGQLSADSFGIFVGIAFLSFAYLGGISSIGGALLAGTFLPLGINYVFFTRVLGSRIAAFDTYYFILGGLGLIVAAAKNPDGIAGAIHRKQLAAALNAHNAKTKARGGDTTGRSAPSRSPRSGLPVGLGLTDGSRSGAELGPVGMKSPRSGSPVGIDSPMGLEAQRSWGPSARKSPRSGLQVGKGLTGGARSAAELGPASIRSPAVRDHRVRTKPLPGLRVQDLSVTYGGLTAVDRLSLEVPLGQIVGLIGPNGAGKTTLIDALTGFTPSTGEVWQQGEDLTHMPAYERARSGLARTWQSVELFEELSVRANVMVGAERTSITRFARDVFRPSDEHHLEDVESLLLRLGLSGEVNKRPSELSLGQKKLVAIARALAMSPKTLLLDEPAAGLDQNESAELGGRLQGIADSGVAILLVDHDMTMMFEICDELVVMQFGVCIARGTPQKVRDDPRVIAAYLGDHISTVTA